jgi:hypothetical protein
VRKPKESSVGLEPEWSPSPSSALSSTSQPTPTPAATIPSVLEPGPHAISCPHLATTTTLSGPLVVHLFDCELVSSRRGCLADVLAISTGFTRVPQHRHPLLLLPTLRQTLVQHDWRPDLLPAPTQALTLAVLATAALVSPHPAILGEGPTPKSLDEVSSWPASTDWASFGRRREGHCRALTEEAFRAAHEAAVTMNWSAESAVTCYLLDFLDSRQLLIQLSF